MPIELSAYQHKETGVQPRPSIAWCGPAHPAAPPPRAGPVPSCNLLGPTALGFRHRDDVQRSAACSPTWGARHVQAPLDASPADLARLCEADFNVAVSRDRRCHRALLAKTYGQPTVSTVPFGVGATRDFIRQVAELAGVDPAPPRSRSSRLPWYSRSVDSTYLTSKRVFVFGDATHAIAAARIAQSELGFEIVGLGSYSREQAREVRAAAQATACKP